MKLFPCLQIVIVVAFMGSMPSAHALELRLPIRCDVGATCEIQNYVDLDPSPKARDYQCGSRTYDGHKGIDFRIPSIREQRRGVDVLAAAAGRVLRVRDGATDVSVRERGARSVEGRECGNGVIIDHGEGWTTQYCHMAQDSLKVRPGDTVESSQPLGRVGLSGLTEYPHLHFSVMLQGKLVEPFAFEAPSGGCGTGRSLWESALQPALAYKARAVLNSGFAAGPVNMATIEAGEIVAPTRDATYLVAYVRTIGAKTGDVQKLTIEDSENRLLVENRSRPLEKDKAQAMMFVGTKAPTGGWPSGIYRATYTVARDTAVVLQHTFSLKI